MINNLSNKNAIIIGGTGTLGEAISKKLYACGADILIVSRNRKKLNKLSREISPSGERVLNKAIDISNDAQLIELTQFIKSRYKKIDILCNCAGLNLVAPIEEINSKKWDLLWKTNVSSIILLTGYLAPFFSKGGSIINIGSSAGIRPISEYSAYTSTKAAIIHFTQAAALELAKKQIRVNCICPGVIPSKIHSINNINDPEIYYEMMRRETPIGRLGDPEEIAEAILFLVGSNSNWITGAILTIDGGLSLT